MKQYLFKAFPVTLLFYGLFLLFNRLIHTPLHAVPEEAINPWLRGRVFKDGVEVPVMFLASFLYLGLIYLLTRSNGKIATLRQDFDGELSRTAQGKLPRNDGPGKLMMVFLLVGFALLIFLSLDQPILWDYNFLVGPAWKLHQGEVLGSFYMRYSLLMTFLFKLMVDLNFRLPQMQLVIAASFAIWLVPYYFLASRLLKDKFLTFTFLVLWIILRFLAIYHDPTAVPQNSPLRFDLWVLPLLIMLRFKLSPVKGAAVFAALYLSDNFLTFFTAGDFITAQVDFIPISVYSWYWIVFAFLPVFLYCCMKEQDLESKKIFYFILLIGLLQLTYFYGRSHDNNLLNISGIFILMLFITLKRVTRVVPLILVVVAVFIFWGNIEIKGLRILQTLKSGQSLKPYAMDEYIDSMQATFGMYKKQTDKLIILSIFDSYYYYRFNIRQPGFYAPLFGSVYLKDTVNALTQYLNEGYTVLFWEKETADQLPFFGTQFAIARKGNIFELKLIQ